MTEQLPMAFRFTEEELVVLYQLSVASPDELPYEELLPDYDTQQRKLALDIAWRGLLARGMLQVDSDGKTQLNGVAVGAAAVGLILDADVTIMRQPSNGTPQVIELFALGDSTQLLHITVDNNLHEYVVLNDNDLYQAALRIGIGLPDSELSEEVSESVANLLLPSEVLGHAMAKGLSGDSADVTAALSGFGPENAVERLAHTLTGGSEYTSIVKRAEDEMGDVIELAMAVLHGNGKWWQVDQADIESAVSLRLLPAAAVDETVREFAML